MLETMVANMSEQQLSAQEKQEKAIARFAQIADIAKKAEEREPQRASGVFSVLGQTIDTLITGAWGLLIPQRTGAGDERTGARES